MLNSAEQKREQADSLLAANRLDEAIAVYREAIRLQPDDVAALNNLAFVLLGTGRVDDAIEASRQAIALRPDLSLPYQNLADALKQAGRVDEALECYERAPKSAHLESERLFTLHLKEDVDPQKLLEEHRAWDQKYAQPLRRFARPHENDRNPARGATSSPQARLRIGYVAYHLGNHPLGRFLLPLIENHDRSAFEVFCYCDSRSNDHVGDQLFARTETWRTTKEMTDEQLAEQMREDRIDVLVDLMMHAGQHRLLAFARKPAPVQVTYLAYPGTTGMEAMDYRLTDPYLDPLPIAPDSNRSRLLSGAIGNDARYSEQSVWLPHTFWCYPPPPEAPAVRPPPVIKAGHIAFGCFNSFSKVTPNVLTTWCELLKRVPTSTLALTCPDGSARQLVLERVKQSRIDVGRITFVRNAPMATYFSMYHHIDIALNPFPYPGGTTTCDALWMGVPVVSMSGKTAASRGPLSILSNVGLGEMVAQSPQQYVDIAATLAADVPRLIELRNTMRQRMQSSPLINAPQFTRDIEAAFRIMWRRWCETGTPARDTGFQPVPPTL